MRGIFESFTNDDTYGPGTDLAMALLGLFILSSAVHRKDETDQLKETRSRQRELVRSMERTYKVTADSTCRTNDSTVWIFRMPITGTDEIEIENDRFTQTFRFGTSTLFDIGSAELKDQGESVLIATGKLIRERLVWLNEIKIEGHADTSRIRRTVRTDTCHFADNIELASARAHSVWTCFKDSIGIDPSQHLMSIVSFGEYKPVTRKAGVPWRWALTGDANSTKDMRSRNRRIEVVLDYTSH